MLLSFRKHKSWVILEQIFSKGFFVCVRINLYKNCRNTAVINEEMFPNGDY